MPRRRQRRAAKFGKSLVRVQKTDAKLRIKRDRMGRPDGVKKPQCGVVATHEKVLAIVDDRTRGRIAKGTRPPAEIRLLLKQPYTPAGLGQRNASRQACKSSADDQNVVRHNGSGNSLECFVDDAIDKPARSPCADSTARHSGHYRTLHCRRSGLIATSTARPAASVVTGRRALKYSRTKSNAFSLGRRLKTS